VLSLKRFAAATAVGLAVAAAIATVGPSSGLSRRRHPTPRGDALEATEFAAAAQVTETAGTTSSAATAKPTAAIEEEKEHESSATEKSEDAAATPAALEEESAGETAGDTQQKIEGHAEELDPKNGRTAYTVTKADEEKYAGCAPAGASCLKAKCCKDAGHQCFTKDNWWGECMVSCIKGPNVIDQSSPNPWACEALGERTPGEPKECSDDGDDCTNTKCCKSGGMQCYEKNEYWATCRAECTPGPNMKEKDWKPWSCKELGPRKPGAAPWVQQRCAHGGEPCAAKGCCAVPGHQCYTQSQYYSQCKPSCTPGEKANPWDTPWKCDKVGMRTPARADNDKSVRGMVSAWVVPRCAAGGENCLKSQCCHAIGHQCYQKNDYWASCRPECTTDPDKADNSTWNCKTLGPRSWGLAIRGWPSIYCLTLFMPSSYEGGLLKHQLSMNAGIFGCDGYDVFAAEQCTLGKTKDDIVVSAIQIPKIRVGVSQDGTAGNAKLFMAVWDKVIAGARFRDYDFTIKVDPDAVLIPWRIRDHMRPHVGCNAYVVNCNKFPGSPNFPMMYGAVEIFSNNAMNAYAMGSWKCGTQLPWKAWGEDYYMTHCLDYLGVGRIADFGVVGDNVCTGANCADTYKGSFHPFKSIDAWNQCWTQATASHK